MAEWWLRLIAGEPDESTAGGFGKDAAVGMNVWVLPPAILGACRRIEAASRGEVELPRAVQWAIEQLGMRVRALPVRATVLDLSHRGDVPVVAARLRGTTVRL